MRPKLVQRIAGSVQIRLDIVHIYDMYIDMAMIPYNFYKLKKLTKFSFQKLILLLLI